MRYFVVGDGGSLYGPADTGQLQKWIEENRILPTTKLKEEQSGRILFASEVRVLRFPPSQNPLGGYDTIADNRSVGQGPAPYVPPQSSGFWGSAPSSAPGPTPTPGNFGNPAGGPAPYGNAPQSGPHQPYGSNPYGPSPMMGQYANMGTPVDTTTPLVKSIIGLTCCCGCGAIASLVGLIYSFQAMGEASRAGSDIQRDCAAKANIWGNWGLGISVLSWLAYFGLILLGALAAPTGY